jgi:hypothetical protein
MKHAFQAAGLNTDTVRLEALLTDLHKHHSGDKRKIAGGLAVAVLNDKTLLGVIIDYYIAGHSVSVPHQTDASNDGGRFACEPQPMLASVVPINRRRTDAERAGAVRYAVSIYDTYRLEDGTPIGDVKLSSILSYTWNIWEQNIALNQIKDGWSIIAWAIALGTVTNILWMTVAHFSTTDNERYMHGWMWDAMITATFALVPLLLSSVTLTPKNAIGAVITLIGLVLLR